MSKWPIKPLGEVCDINPRSNGAEMLRPEQKVSFVPMAAVDETVGKIFAADSRPVSECLKGFTAFQDRDVLFAKITPCMENGKAAIASKLIGGRGFGSTEFHVLRPKAGVLAEWIFAFIRQPAFRNSAKRSFTGSAGQQRVPTDFLRAVLIAVPPLAEQERIVRLLDEATTLRRLRTQADERTATAIPAIFDEMFGDPEAPTSCGHRIKLGAITEVKAGAGFPLEDQGLTTERYPFFKVGDMNNEGNETSLQIAQHTISEETRSRLRATLFPKGTIVFPKVGAAIGTNKKRVLGQASCVDNNVMGVLPSAALTPEWLHSLFLRKRLMDFANEGNPPSIRQSAVADWEISAPSISEQEVFSARVAEIRALEAEQVASRKRLDDLFQSLLHRAFSGDL